MLLTKANLLVLDEPTNHLDIEGQEMLEEALRYYDGSLLLISHDRYFCSQVVTQIAAIEEQRLVLYDGDYREYLRQNELVKQKIEGRYHLGVSKIIAPRAPKLKTTERSEFLVDGRPFKAKTNLQRRAAAAARTSRGNQAKLKSRARKQVGRRKPQADATSAK